MLEAGKLQQHLSVDSLLVQSYQRCTSGTSQQRQASTQRGQRRKVCAIAAPIEAVRRHRMRDNKLKSRDESIFGPEGAGSGSSFT